MSRHTAIFKAVFCIAIVLTIHKTALADYTTNAVPYTNTWDSTSYANGYAATNLPGWNAGANDTSYITNMTYTHPNPQPFTPAQNQVLCLNTADGILTNRISSKLSASEPVIFDSVMNFQPNASTPTILTANGTNDIGIKFSIFVDANTNLNIYHGWLNGSAGNWASNGITVITNQPTKPISINTANWYRVTVTFDASKQDGSSVIFPAMQVAINGTNVQSSDAYDQGAYQNWTTSANSHPTTSPTGTWFRTAINSAATANTSTNIQYINNIGFQGSGYVDEIQVNANETLTLNSAYGSPSQSGTNPYNYSNAVSAWVTSPVLNGTTTQYLCSAVAVAGNAYTAIGFTNVSLTITNNTTVSWTWQTNYWLGLSMGGTGSGSLDTSSGMKLLGTTPTVTATATTPGSIFTGWTGQTNGCTISGNQITVPMNSAVAITANFGPAPETVTVSTAHGTPAPGTTTVNYNTAVTETINSPILDASSVTQYVCTGASVAGNAYSQNSATNVSLTLTNTASLTWLWGQTNYWLTLSTSGTGSGALSTTSAWYVAGNNATVTATPVIGSTFTGWSGATNGCTISGTQITVPMNSPASITATFTLNQETLTVNSIYGGVSPGTVTTSYGAFISEWVTNSPILNGTTQYVCIGASVIGNTYATNGATNVTMTLTNTASLTWLWQTNYWLAASNNGTGTTFGNTDALGNTWTNIGAGAVTGAWYLAGSTAVVTAAPPAGVTWSTIHGETNVMSFAVTGALVAVVMSQPAVIIANFQTPVNSAGITVGMYQDTDGLHVQFVSLDEGNEGIFTVTVTDALGNTWTGTIPATGIAGPNVYQLLIPGLVVGPTYNISITDLSGGGQTFTANLTGFANNVTMTQTGIAIQFNSNPGDTYQIQWTPTLGGTWTTVLTTNAVDVQSSVFINFQDPVSPSTGFFRVVDSTLSSQ